MKVNDLLFEEKRIINRGVTRDERQIRLDYIRWRRLVNISVPMLKKLLSTDAGKNIGLRSREMRTAGGVKNGAGSIRAIIRMKSKPFADWTSTDVNWMYRQLTFICKMREFAGSEWTIKDKKTGKHVPSKKLLRAWMWGHAPKGFSPSRFKM